MNKIILPFTILIIALLSINCSNNKNVNIDNSSEVKNRFVTQILNFPEFGEDTLKASLFVLIL